MNTGHGAGERVFAVDRIEGATIVLVDDDSSVVEIEGKLLPASCRVAGAVLRVPVDSSGSAQWDKTVRDKHEEHRRISDANARLEKLRRTDPGGDVEL